MSRAYCLTCNEQVHETPSGTCPLGHPVTTADHGPEPWVGFAEVEGRTVTTHVDHSPDDEVPMERLDAAGRPVAHAGAATGGHLNGHVNGHANGHGVPSGLLDGPPSRDHAPADDGHAVDDLAALLAEALQQEEAPAPVADDTEADAAGLWDADWDELSGLAAELQLDADHTVDDCPAATPAPPADRATPSPVPADVDAGPDEATDVPDLDALLAELTAESAPEPPAAAVAPPSPAPPVAPPPPPVATPAPPVAPPPPPVVEPAPPVDPVPAFDDVPSPAPVDDAAGLWDDVQEAEAPAPAPEVDLTNFTARGSRVGGGGSARSPRSWLKKKTR